MTSLREMRLEPRQKAKLPPCGVACAAGVDVRGWIGVIAQRRKMGIGDREAYSRAWEIIAAANPFPATLGRICPHPCETACTRGQKDGAVAINALERFVGDCALREHLPLPVLDRSARAASIGVIGAGPAGLSFAYQMARRGYRVTVYEERQDPGGMLKHVIPDFRLPSSVVDKEIGRLLNLPIELQCGTKIGRDVVPVELCRRHAVLFVGIGAARAANLNVPGMAGQGVWLALDYLAAIKRGQPVETASRVVVVGGGDTALDAARLARRKGAQVTILYRRTRAEMPANAHELDAALSEGVALESLASPVGIERHRGLLTHVIAQRMTLAGSDASGRRRPIPLTGGPISIAADAVILALSQEPDWSALDELRMAVRIDELEGTDWNGTHIFTGGDLVTPGIAAQAIAHGRRAAERADALLRGLPDPNRDVHTNAAVSGVRAEYYCPKPRARVPARPVPDRLRDASTEVEQTLAEETFLDETARCFSCGLCYGCEQCFMYCSARAFEPLEMPNTGRYFALNLDRCEGCGKCIELCPCAYLEAGGSSVGTTLERAIGYMDGTIRSFS